MCLCKHNSQPNSPNFSNEFPLVIAFSSFQIECERLQNLDNNFENPALNQDIYIIKTTCFVSISKFRYLFELLSTYFCVKLIEFIQTRKIIGLEKRLKICQ